MRSRKAIVPLVHLLAEVEPGATPDNDRYAPGRAAAVRALAGQGGEAGEALLRFKLLIGDPNRSVIEECLTSLLGLTRSADVVEPFLDSPDEELRQVAILALAESRLPEAFSILRSRWDRQFDADARHFENILLLVPLGRTREDLRGTRRTAGEPSSYALAEGGSTTPRR